MLQFILLMVLVLLLTGFGPDIGPGPCTLEPIRLPLPTPVGNPPIPTASPFPDTSPNNGPKQSPSYRPIHPREESPFPIEPQRQTAIWTRLPLENTSNPWLQAYGNTEFAYDAVYGSNRIEYGMNFYRFSGGLHGGFDLGGVDGDLVIAGTSGMVTEVVSGNNEKHAAVYIIPDRAPTYKVKYQHLVNIPQAIKDMAKAYQENRFDDAKITESDHVGELGPLEQHVHLEVRKGYSTLHNPIIFFDRDLFTDLVDTRINGTTSGERFYQNPVGKLPIPWQSELIQPVIPQNYYENNSQQLILQQWYGVEFES